MSEVNRITIPLVYAQNMDEAAEFILKNRCRQTADKAAVTGYKQAMAVKGAKSVRDLKAKDVRWWGKLRQALSATIVVNETDLPSCPVVEEAKKPEIKIKIAPITSQPATLPKPVEIKVEQKAVPQPPVKTRPATKNKKDDRKTFIP